MSKKATEKQLKALDNLTRNSKFSLSGKRVTDLNISECCVLIDFLILNNKSIKESGSNINIDDYFNRKAKIIITDLLTYDENKIIGQPSQRAMEFLEKLMTENKYAFAIPKDLVTAKVVYQLTNHLLEKEIDEELANKFLKDLME